MPKKITLVEAVIHDYILAFGLLSLKFVYLESRLRACLRAVARVRSRWPLTPRRVAALKTLHEETTLGGLVPVFKRQGGPTTLVNNLELLLKPRNEMHHQVFLLTSIQQGHIPLPRVQARTKQLNAIGTRVQGRMQAVLKFHYTVFRDLARLEKEHNGSFAEADALVMMGKTVELYPDS